MLNFFQTVGNTTDEMKEPWAIAHSFSVVCVEIKQRIDGEGSE